MEIEPIARFCSPFTSKFGIPRQSGVVPELRGRIVMLPPYNSADPLRGLDGYDYLWLIWGFSANEGAAKHLTVRPPRLGGNERMGVFATRSPFRPNNIGLSAVKLESINLEAKDGPEICVSGADLMDGTPIYDIKPYITFTDSHAEARSGIVDSEAWKTLAVADPDGLLANMDGEEAAALAHTLEQDPRPHYHDDPLRIYGMPFGQWEVRFRVCGGQLTIVSLTRGRE